MWMCTYDYDYVPKRMDGALHSGKRQRERTRNTQLAVSWRLGLTLDPRGALKYWQNGVGNGSRERPCNSSPSTKVGHYGLMTSSIS